ncbi:bile acid:sodium symporter family protein [Methanomethylophilus alvi]|uniref:bile acid:sodium symporter family protein n=1 Tax=Methanomethylophilus alvi TaxID=1291540 RepID=UPI0037DBF2E4
MKAINLVCSTAFMMGAALVISLLTNVSGIFPDEVLTSDIRSNLTIFLLAVMLTITLSRIPFRNLDPVKNYRSVIRAVLLGLVFASVIPLAAYYILNSMDGYEAYAKGLVFLAATPFAASVGPLSLILRGDLEHALRSTIIVYVISLVWIPFIIWLTLGEIVDMTKVVITVIELIGVPLVVSRLITKVKIDKTVMSVVLNCVIAFLVWLSVSSTNFPKDMVILVVFMFVAFLRDFGLGSATEVMEKKSGIPWSQRVTDILMISYKNKGIAIALCVSVMTGPAIGNAMVPIAASIVIEIIWVAFMDSVLFSKKRMNRELEADREAGLHQTWE